MHCFRNVKLIYNYINYIYMGHILLNLVHIQNLQFLAIICNLDASIYGFCSKLNKLKNTSI